MDLKEILKPYITVANDALDEALTFEEPSLLVKPMRHMTMAGGKRLRPVMAMLVAESISGSYKRALTFGTALEIIHNFTLLHDDIMDHDELRRGIKTVHIEFDEATAINAGDALFALAFEILSTVDIPNKLVRTLISDVARTVRLIGEGQQMDKEFEQRTDIQVKDYMLMIEYKTAVLFAAAAEGGALTGDASPELVTDMAEYGRLIGLGFQIWDDYLGLKANEATLGKPVGSDILNGKRTLIAVVGLGRMDEGQNEKFMKTFGNLDAEPAKVKGAIGVLEEVGAVNHAKDIALKYCEEAKQLLHKLPGSKTKDILGLIADYMVMREK